MTEFILSYSPSAYWAVFNFLWAMLMFSTIFIQPIICHLIITKPFDKRYRHKLVHTPLEEGAYISGAFFYRLMLYIKGILLQKYRYRENRGILKRFVNGTFLYQDAVFEKEVNLEQEATIIQIFVSKFYIISFTVMVLTMPAMLVHDFIIYPEWAAAHIEP